MPMHYDTHPELPFGAINVLVLTDVHSWVGGHRRQEPFMDADFGVILSFYERLKAHCELMGMDLWFVSNGDWAHGTGLAGPGESSGLLPILEKMPWDAVNCGNHELYENAKVESMIRPGGFVDWFGDRYLTANILKTNDGSPLGYHFKVLEGVSSSVLTFGFLYNMGDPCDLIEIAPVEKVVKERWFRQALESEYYDAILILAHMDMADPLVNIIRTAIRDIAGSDIPIQFITGHTHYRGVTKLDDLSFSFEGGRYLDTLGFVSFPTRFVAANSTGPPEEVFQSVFLDTNIEILSDTLGMQDLSTPNGKALSDFIQKTQKKMGLLEEVGCAPMDYVRIAPLQDPKSLYGLYKNEVIPKMFFSQEDTEESTSVMFLPQESFRYDLLSRSRLLVDDIWGVAPFNDTVIFIGSFSGQVILELNKTMNGNPTKELNGTIPSYIMIGKIPDEARPYKFYTHDFGSETIVDALKKIDPSIIIQPTSTPYTSTMIWLSFAMEHWPCDGSPGLLPDWVPTPDKVTKQLGREDDENAKRLVTVGLIILLFLSICGVFSCFRMWMRHLFVGGNSISLEEMDAFKDEETSFEEKDQYPPVENGIDLTDEDREML